MPKVGKRQTWRPKGTQALRWRDRYRRDGRQDNDGRDCSEGCEWEVALSDGMPSYLEPLAGFAPRKVAQMCVYFALKEGEGIEKLKLIKLIYLSDREFIRKYGDPITWDEYYSLPHGPVCSAALNCINKVIYKEVTDGYFLMNGNFLVPVSRLEERDLDELSRAEIEVMASVWMVHGHLSASQLRNYSHEHCPEYTEIENGRIPIEYEAILNALSVPDPAGTASDAVFFRKVVSQYA